MKDDRPRTLTDGSPVYDGHKEIAPDGMQRGYVVLSEEERAKGFIRPVRRSYIHVGIRPTYPTRPLTEEEQLLHSGSGYVAYEAYPESLSPLVGRYWSNSDLNSGCSSVTTMGLALAETYARDPFFYSGTFCATCRAHFPVGPKGEFVWCRERPEDPIDQKVGT